MSTTHLEHTGGRAGAWRTLLMVAALGAVTLVPDPVRAANPPGVGGVTMAGPTGVRTGVEVADAVDAPDPATIAPFDTYGRDPALLLIFQNTEDGEGWVAWDVAAVAATDPSAAPTSLAAGVADVPVDRIDLVAPPPGDWLVTAELVAGAAGPEGTWAWHLVIPDRSLPEILPAPDIVLFGGGGTVIAARGSGCHLHLCGDIGGLPPDRSLPAVRLARPDEPIALTLSDGSGIVRITVHAVRLNVDETAPVPLVDGQALLATNVILVPPPPSAGRWRLEIFVAFSDGRGDQAGYARVVVPGP